MDKFIALFAIALGAVYTDLDGGTVQGGMLFPALFVIGIGYLFWFKGFVVIAAGTTAGYYSDLSSNATFESILLPLMVVICLFYLLIWLYSIGAFVTHGRGGGDGSGGSDGCDSGGGGDC